MASYVYGNVVRKESVAPSVPKRQEEKKVSTQVRKNRRHALHMSRSYVVFLTIASVIAVFACVQYLQLQSEVVARTKNIAAMQQQLENLKEDNTTRYNAIMNSMNLEEIRDRAMNELGMVYAKEGQVVTYEDPTNHAVIMHETIPESGIIASEMK